MSAQTAQPDLVIDDAVSAASGIRAAARWTASAFAGIPSLAIVAALIKGPGDGGFDDGLLFGGIAFAALGALIGVLGFAPVFSPVPLTDLDLESADGPRSPGVPPLRIPGLPDGIANYNELENTIADAAIAAAQAEIICDRAQAHADAANDAATHAESLATAAETIAALAGATNAQKIAALAARSEANIARGTANDAKRTASYAKVDKSDTSRELERFRALRDTAFRLQASTVVGLRFFNARLLSVIAVVLVGAGIGMLATAPKQKRAAAVTPLLVRLDLTPEGQAQLACKSPLQALKVGGDETKPTIITLATSDCPARTAEFPTTGKKPWGSVTELKQLKPKPEEG